MGQTKYHKTSFTLDHPTLKLVDDFCEDNDLTRAQAIRRGLRIMLATEGIEPVNGKPSRPRAPRPQPRQDA